MPEWILADAHGGADPEADADLLRLLDRAIERRAELWILGDLFVAWVALAPTRTPLQATVVERLVALRRAGGRSHFVVGNRDYLVREGLAGVVDRVIEEGARVELGGVATWLEHGDVVNPDDRPYLAWRRLSRSAAVSAGLSRLPGPLAAALARRVERALGPRNQRYKTGRLPEAALRALGERAAARGASRAVIGHFHIDRTIEGPGAPVRIAPAWLESRQVLVVGPGGALDARGLDAL